MVDGNSETECTFVSPQTSQQKSTIHFPGQSESASFVPDMHRVVLLGSDRSRNSKRLVEPFQNEENELDANASDLPLNRNTHQDRRKMSRKSDDELMGTVYDSSASPFDGNGIHRVAQWWPPVTLNCQCKLCSLK